MAPETVAATFACAKLGAIFLPIFSGYGAEAVATRLQDAEAVALITADGFTRAGQGRADEGDGRRGGRRMSPTVRTRSSCGPRSVGDDAPWIAGPRRPLGRAARRPVRRTSRPSRSTASTRCSSRTRRGTTGRPKGVGARARRVPGEGRRGGRLPDRPAPRTTIAVLAHRPRLDHGTVGDRRRRCARRRPSSCSTARPTHPGPDRLWELVERHRITVLGMSPTLIRALMPHGEEPVRATTCRRCASSARPASRGTPSPWRWFFDEVGGGRCPIINISGGTEVGACFLSPLADHAAQAVHARRSRAGHGRRRVRRRRATRSAARSASSSARKPWPGMTRGHLERPAALPRHLLVALARTCGCTATWRVDRRGRVLVPARPLRRHDQARRQAARAGRGRDRRSSPIRRWRRAAAVGVPDEVKGEAVWCFVVLKPGVERGRRAARRALGAWSPTTWASRSARPRIVFVAELPKTRSAKILRRAIRAAVLGRDPGDLSSLENPGALEGIRDRILTSWPGPT